MRSREHSINSILQTLRSHQKGMSITEISRATSMNRNSCAKYLDILLVNGQIEMKAIGKAKMYYLSQRVPISALLDFSSDHIMVLDSDLKIVEVNDNLLKLLKVKKEMLLDTKITSSSLPLLSLKEDTKRIREAIRGIESSWDADFNLWEQDYSFRMKLLRSTLGDGSKGVTIIMEDITQRKKAQREVQANEARLRNIMLSLYNSFIGLINKNLVFEEFWGTKDLDEKYGFPHGKIKRMSILDFTPRHKKLEIRRQLEECFDTGTPFRTEHQVDLPNGRFWQEWSFSPYRTDEGKIEFIVMYGTDIQDRKEMTESVKDKERRIRNILSSLYGSFIGVINRDMVYESFYGSKELDSRYGLKSKEVTGRRITDFTPPGHEKEMENIVRTVFETKQPVTIEVPGDLPKGRFWQVMTFTPYRSKDDEAQFVVQFGSDTTDKHEVFEKLKEVEARYKLLDENSSDVIWMTDADLKYTYLSSSTKKLTGYEPSELMGKSVLDRISGTSRENLMSSRSVDLEDFFRGARKEYPNQTLQMELVRKDGTPILSEINISITVDEEGRPQGLVGITRDITERKLQQERLEMLSSAFRITLDPIVIVGMDLRIIDVNDAFLKFFKIKDRESVTGEDATIFLNPLEMETAMSNIEKLLTEGSFGPTRYRSMDSEGNEFIMMATATILWDGEGNPKGFVVIGRPEGSF
ncbi:MAG: PAS domain S-box protein [Thermoplasmatota archaeon]